MDFQLPAAGCGAAAPPAPAAALEDSSWLSDNDFMMYKFKVLLCNKHYDHNMDTCPYAHKGERTCKRRDPARVNYTSIICLDMMQKGKCPRGRSCTSAHTIYEYWLHPHRYRTEMCKVGPTCTRRICFFAHKPEELRPLPPHLAGTSGGADTGKYSLSATRQAAAAAAATAAAAAAATVGARAAGLYGCSGSTNFLQQQQQQYQQACAFPAGAGLLGYNSNMYAAAGLMQPPAAAVHFNSGLGGAGGYTYSPFVSAAAVQGLGGHHQQPAAMVSSGLVPLPTGPDTPPSWQQHQQHQQQQSALHAAAQQQAVGGDLMAQMQRLRLASLTGGHSGPGSSAGHSPAHSMCAGSSMLSLCTPETTSQASAQQHYSLEDNNSFLSTWQQPQPQQLLHSAIGPGPQHQQPPQQHQLFHMLASQPPGYHGVKSVGGVHVATSGALAAPAHYSQPEHHDYMYLGQLAPMKQGPYSASM